MKVERHSSHPEIHVGHRNSLTGCFFMLVSIVCLIAAFILLMFTHFEIKGGNARLDVAEQHLQDSQDDLVRMEHICDLAVVTCAHK